MQRTTISLERSTIRALREHAAERGISMAELIREAIDEKLSRRKVVPRSFGVVSSGHTDTGRLSGEVRPEPRSWRS
jgi:hypothetical protein